MVLVLTRCERRRAWGAVAKAPFVDDAEAICAEANRQLALLGPQPPILPDEQARWVERVGATGRGATADLRAARPSAESRYGLDACSRLGHAAPRIRR